MGLGDNGLGDNGVGDNGVGDRPLGDNDTESKFCTILGLKMTHCCRQAKTHLLERDK